MHDDNAILQFIDEIISPKPIQSILDIVCQTTGMGFAAVMHVTDEKWTAYSVRDLIAFGLTPGDEIEVENTICHEIRKEKKIIIIEDVTTDTLYCNHRAPNMYKFRSYISMPIILNNMSYFGAICAINPEPLKINTPEIVKMFETFAEIVGYYFSTFTNEIPSYYCEFGAQGIASVVRENAAIINQRQPRRI